MISWPVRPELASCFRITLQRNITGVQDLSQVTFLELSVNTADQSVAQIGELCPNLLQLKLNDSYLQSIRDLGTAIRNLQVLWLSRCGVTDLDGISVLEHLTELYLSFNNVEDITPLSLHEHLEVSSCVPAVCARVCGASGGARADVRFAMRLPVGVPP